MSREEGEEGEAVAVEAEAGDDALADRRQQGLVAKWFTRIDVADVDLDHRGGDSSNSIGDGNRRVGVPPSVEDDAAVVKAHLLQAVHDFSLDIALEDIYRVLRKQLGQFLQVLVERTVAIDLGLTFAHEVQVGAIDDVDNHLIS